MGGGGPSSSASQPFRWSKRAIPGIITPSLGSTETAIRAMVSGGRRSPRAEAVAAMAAETSALLLPIPLLRGMGLLTVTLAPSPDWPR